MGLTARFTLEVVTGEVAVTDRTALSDTATADKEPPLECLSSDKPKRVHPTPTVNYVWLIYYKVYAS